MAQNVLAKVAVEIAANTAAFTSGLAKAESSLNRFSGKLNNFATTIAAGFGLTEIVGGVIQVTSQFQKFEAVLTNSLGSNSAAQSALNAIRDFALQTPFEVSEITAAYVRWTNQGLTPTIAKMRMLGDVASSLGAGFEQTAEAFKDLAVGQTKRLEEIGISATQQNGKIQLSFKGVNIEIEKNAQGVQKALETYSQLNGVLGSTDAVSKTLGGRISNLKDAYDNLLLTLGQANSGVLFNTVNILTNLSIAAANAGTEFELFARRSAYTITTIFTAGLGEKIAQQNYVAFESLSKDAQDYLVKLGNTASGKKVSDVLGIVEAGKSALDLLKNLSETNKRFSAELAKEGETRDDINAIWNVYLKKLGERAKLEAQSNAAAKIAADLAKKNADKEAAAILAAKKIEEQKKSAAEAEKQRLKDAQDAWNEMMRERSKTLKDLEEQIKIVGEGLAYRYAGAEAFNVKPLVQQLGGDKGMLPVPPGMTEQIANYQKEIGKANESNAVFAQGVAELNNAFGQAAAGGITDFLTGLGDVAAGQITFGQLILESIGKFMKQFGAALIQMGIAKSALNKLFSTPAGAAVAIAAGTALVALGGIVSKSAAKQTSRMGNGIGGGGGTGFSSQTVSAQNAGSNISITGELRGSGRDLVAVINQTSFDNKVRKGG